jgi:enoyl-CoA hydratase/carnithine racemase
MSEATAVANRRLSTLSSHLIPHSKVGLLSLANCSNTKPYENVLTEQRGKVGIVFLHRPKALNALNGPHVQDIVDAVRAFDAKDDVHAIILTGSEKKAFAAGADIKQMGELNFAKVRFSHDVLDLLASLEKIKKPLIAAVNGYAFGGGCELAMSCDIIIAGDNAQFGQPEIKIGTIPGLGGTQRLVHAVGKSRAMEMVLTGNPISALEAEKAGLVSRVVPVDQTLDAALKVANQIASLSKPIVAIAKESVNAAFEHTLAEGLHFERRLFQSTFGLEDRKEGMDAFANKRAPKWTHQ